MATYLVARLGVDALLTQSLDNTCGVAHMPTASHYYHGRFTPDYYTDLRHTGPTLA
jgi:hypothetical protein